MTVVAEGLRFPEGPVALPDGSVLVVEIARQTLSRVRPDGTVEVVAETGGGPNGAAFGPDGRVWICNNGGFEWRQRDGRDVPGPQPADYTGGSIQAVDLDTGVVETIYTHCGEDGLRGGAGRRRRGSRLCGHHPQRRHHRRGPRRFMDPRAHRGSADHQCLLRGDDLRTAYITCSASGTLVRTQWPRPGLKLHHNPY